MINIFLLTIMSFLEGGMTAMKHFLDFQKKKDFGVFIY